MSDTFFDSNLGGNPPDPNWLPPPYNPLFGGQSPYGGGDQGAGYNQDGTNTWLGYFDGTGNPNTGFNPNIGTWQGSSNQNLSTGGTGVSTTNAAPQPSNDEYQTWLWEQILNEVLGFTSPPMPSRRDISGPANRWTGLEFDSNGDGSRFYIYGVTHGDHGSDTLVYLSTDLLVGGGPWDSFLNAPPYYLYESETGQLHGWTTALDPDSFDAPIAALYDVEGFFANAATSLNAFSSALASDESAYQGQAGAAFAQIVWDLWNQTDAMSTQMGLPDAANSYSQQLLDAGYMAEFFLYLVWAAYSNWTYIMEHSPLGAILWALLNSTPPVVVGSPGNWNTNPDMDPTNTPFGDLTTDQGWVSVENVAKDRWNKVLKAALDVPAQGALMDLVTRYGQTISALGVVQAPTNPQITPPQPNYGFPNNGGGTINFGGFNFPPFNIGGNSSGPDPNLFNDMFSGMNNLATGIGNGFNDMFSGMNNLGTGIGNAFSNLGAGVGNGFNGLFNGINGLGSGIGGAFSSLGSGLGSAFNSLGSSLGNGFNSLGSGLGSAFNSVGGVPNALNNAGLGSALQNLGANPNLSTQLGNALAGTGATQAALRHALALAPASGPLHNALAGALADTNQAQATLDRFLHGGAVGPKALRHALADNTKAQALLKKALAMAPASGPLHNAIEQALASTNRTESALKHALATFNPAASSMHHALASDHALETALHKAMTSGQVPKHGPLHEDLQAALADNAKLQHALHQSLAGGVPSEAAIHRAITDNHALQAALHKALGSGELRSGPLRTDLQNAMADSTKLGTELHQALAHHRIVAEPGPGFTLGNQALIGPNAGKGPLVTASGFGGASGSGAGLPGGAGGPGGLGGAAGLAQAAPPVSSGRFVPAGTGAGNGASAVPFFPPMMGCGMGMGMGGGQGTGQQERERTTWLAEDDEVWGTEPELGPQVLGRDFDDDAEVSEYHDDYEERQASRRDPGRQRAR